MYKVTKVPRYIQGTIYLSFDYMFALFWTRWDVSLASIASPPSELNGRFSISHSTVVLCDIGIAMVYPHWKPYIRIFTFNDIKVKNVWKITSKQKFVVLWCKTCVISQKVLSPFCPCSSLLLLLKKRNSITIKSMNLNLCVWKCFITYWGIEV